MGYVVFFGLGVVLGTVVLIASMVIASYVSGGIDFGEVHVVVAKALPLVAVCYGLQLPALGWVGWLASLAVWWFGLMLIFRLDFWEARVLVIINWGLNRLAVLYLLILLHSWFAS